MRQRPPVTRPRATQALEISVQGCRLEFIPVPMRFGRCGMANVFAGLNNKTLAETLLDKRYAKLSEEIRCHYPNSLNDRLGEFLYRLKIANDGFYRRFLNKHGDNVFCDFSIERTSLSETKGIYCFAVGDEAKYVGQTRDSFARRINQGYGHIWPKNCYLDGQSTNCHVNSLVAKYLDVVSLLFRPVEDDSEIGRLEDLLIDSPQLDWNIHH